MPTPNRDLKEIRSTRSQHTFARLIKTFKSRLNIISEGDSWFAYPPKGIIFGKSSNVMSHLKKMKKMNILEKQYIALIPIFSLKLVNGSILKRSYHFIGKIFSRYIIDSV